MDALAPDDGGRGTRRQDVYVFVDSTGEGLGGSWACFGRSWKLFGYSWGALARSWDQDELQDAFWMDVGSLWAGIVFEVGCKARWFVHITRTSRLPVQGFRLLYSHSNTGRPSLHCTAAQ